MDSLQQRITRGKVQTSHILVDYNLFLFEQLLKLDPGNQSFWKKLFRNHDAD